MNADRAIRWTAVLAVAVVAASMVLLDAARHGEPAPSLAWWLLGSGIAVTLAANVTYGAKTGVAGALWAAWPALAFVGSYELLLLLARASARRSGEVRTGTAFAPVPSGNETAEASLRATLALGNPWTINQLAERFSLSRGAATKLRQRVLAESNGQHPGPDGDPPPETP